jgi:hypothetical protein
MRPTHEHYGVSHSFALQKEGVITADDITDLRVSHKTFLEQQLAAIESYKPHVPLLKSQWSGMVWPASKEAQHSPDTGVATDVLGKVGKASVTLPSRGFVRGFCPPRIMFSRIGHRRSTRV